MSCTTNGSLSDTKQIKFVDNILSIVKGSAVIGGISFCDFVDDITDYVHMESTLAANSNVTIIDIPNNYRTIAIKATYDGNTDISLCKLYYQTNTVTYDSGTSTYVNTTTPTEFNIMSEFIIINSNSVQNITKLSIVNPMPTSVSLNYLFAK